MTPTKKRTKPPGKMILVSACLAGFECRFDGSVRLHQRLLKRLKGSVIIPVCPEQMGGLPTPRRPAEIVGGTGLEVLQGKAKVLDSSGGDVTAQFMKGAKAVLRIARLNGVCKAYLKERSPSCGKVKPGPGVTAALLIQEGFDVIGVS